MYTDVVTVFNRYEDILKNVTWYPSVIKGVNLLIDKSAIVAKYGPESKDNAILNIKHIHSVTNNPSEGELLWRAFIQCKKVIDEKEVLVGKEWLPPKEWEHQTNDKLADSITFEIGTYPDFFMFGEYPELNPIKDDDYRNGFFETIKREYDYVFAITSVAMYTTIPHFEITGK